MKELTKPSQKTRKRIIVSEEREVEGCIDLTSDASTKGSAKKSEQLSTPKIRDFLISKS